MLWQLRRWADGVDVFLTPAERRGQALLLEELPPERALVQVVWVKKRPNVAAAPHLWGSVGGGLSKRVEQAWSKRVNAKSRRVRRQARRMLVGRTWQLVLERARLVRVGARQSGSRGMMSAVAVGARAAVGA